MTLWQAMVCNDNSAKERFRKKTVAVIFAGISMFVASIVLAADPVKFTGDFSITYERDTYEDKPAISGTTYSLRLMGEKCLGAGWSLYARLGGEYATQPLLADFNTADEAYGANRKYVMALDQFGLTYKTDKMMYKLGRQDAAVGKTLLLYSRPYTYVGRYYFVNGLTVNGTVGRVEVSALAAREDNPENQNKLYAVRTGYSPVDGLNSALH